MFHQSQPQPTNGPVETQRGLPGLHLFKYYSYLDVNMVSSSRLKLPDFCCCWVYRNLIGKHNGVWGWSGIFRESTLIFSAILFTLTLFTQYQLKRGRVVVNVGRGCGFEGRGIKIKMGGNLPVALNWIFCLPGQGLGNILETVIDQWLQ